MKLRKTELKMDRPYKIPGGLPMAWFAAIAMTVLLVMLSIPSSPAYMGGVAVKMFIAWLIVGLVMFLATGPQRNKLTPEERATSLFASAKDVKK